jgi:putative ATP-dependent endonuclease of OLD family
MQIARIEIANFRCILSGTLLPTKHNVLLGPNNWGKSAILDALDLLLNPELGARGGAIDENDFYCRRYREVPANDESDVEAAPRISVEAVIRDLHDEDKAAFADVLVPWNNELGQVVESAPEGTDPFDGAVPAIRVVFEGWYDVEEDDFAWSTAFKTDPELRHDERPPFTKAHKRRIGFLIYRDFRALQRPVTLQPFALFAKLLMSQSASPRNFDDVFGAMLGAGGPLFADAEFARVVNEYREELTRYLPLGTGLEAEIGFEVTDRTRSEVKAAMQLHVHGESLLPLQKMGAGTRSIAVLAILLLIARKRGRGIIALEEPETFLFPHAQRRVIDEVLSLATQTFVTTHSPVVVERMPIDGLHRLVRRDGTLSMEPVARNTKMAREIRDRFRKQLGEALLGTAAIVVEEEATKLWLLRANELLQRRRAPGKPYQPLELSGTAIVAAEGNGDIAAVARLLQDAGLQVGIYLDQVKDNELTSFMKHESLSWTFHRYKGLEDLLIAELPVAVLRRAMAEAPYTRHLPGPARVATWNDSEVVTKAKDFLVQHKGYLPFQEWLIDQIDTNAIPRSLSAYLERWNEPDCLGCLSVVA